MEIKSHCEKIKRIVGTSRWSQKEEHNATSALDIVLSSSDESVVYECFGTIVAIAQNSAPLENNTLGDFLTTCHSIRKNQPTLAGKVALLMSQANTLIEDLVTPVVSGTQATGLPLQPATIALSISSSQNKSDNDGYRSSSSGVVLSQHGTMSTTPVFLQDMLHKYDLARAATGATSSGKESTEPLVMMSNSNTASPMQEVRSAGPPSIQITTVRSGPPPIQVTTVKSAPPPIQVTTVNQGLNPAESR